MRHIGCKRIANLVESIAVGLAVLVLAPPAFAGGTLATPPAELERADRTHATCWVVNLSDQPLNVVASLVDLSGSVLATGSWLFGSEPLPPGKGFGVTLRAGIDVDFVSIVSCRFKVVGEGKKTAVRGSLILSELTEQGPDGDFRTATRFIIPAT